MHGWTSRACLRSITEKVQVRTHSGFHRWNSTTTHDPLRILFCGADEFSIYSLQAINKLRLSQPHKIASLDVVCRPDKRVGRGLKDVQSVPIKAVANDLDLPVHHLDTFRSWTPPTPINLIIAVSFGLLVPARLLTAAQYGGLNIHPSLLPDLRGPAPIQHALLQRRPYTGVTLQTMHATKFDHGEILAQRISPMSLHNATPQTIIAELGVLGAEMLAESLATGSFRNRPIEKIDREGMSSYAPKITPEDRRVEWASWSGEKLETRDRVLGRLWDVTTYQAAMGDDNLSKRVSFAGPWKVVGLKGKWEPGTPVRVEGASRDARLGIVLRDGVTAGIPRACTIDGDKKDAGEGKLLKGVGVQTDCPLE